MQDKLIKGLDDRFNRQYVPAYTFARDFDTLIGQFEQTKLLGLSRGLYYNNPIVKSALEQKSGYAVGAAFEYRSLSEDDSFRDAANAALKAWSRIAEVSGMTLNDVQYMTSLNIDIAGDIFILLTESKDGYPLIQLIEAHAIGSRTHGKINQGNLWEEKGVLYDKKTRRPVKYRVLAEDPKDDRLVSVRDLIRVSEPSMSLRGIPLVSSCINLLYDLEKSQELLLTQQLLAASISMIEHNESGTNEYNLGMDTSGADGNYEVVNRDGGEIRFYKSNTGSKLELLSNQNPNEAWQQYQDTLTNTAILALDWNKNLLGMSTGTGVNDRLALEQCGKTVEDRQVLLTPTFQRVCNYVLAKLIKNGFLTVSLPEDWFLCTFSKPRKLTVDFARDSKAILEEYKSGIKNLAQILAEEGIDYEDHIRGRMVEEARRIQIKAEVEQQFGVQIDDLNTRVLSQNQFTQDPQNIE